MTNLVEKCAKGRVANERRNMALEASYDVLDTYLSHEVRSELEVCIGLLWPEDSNLSQYCRAVALKCLGFGRGYLFDAEEGVRYVDFAACQLQRPLMQAAADDTCLLLSKPSAVARELLPADFFHVRPFKGLSMAIGLRTAALEEAAQVRSASVYQWGASAQECGAFHSYCCAGRKAVALARARALAHEVHRTGANGPQQRTGRLPRALSAVRAPETGFHQMRGDAPVALRPPVPGTGALLASHGHVSPLRAQEAGTAVHVFDRSCAPAVLRPADGCHPCA